ncbi:MAG: hypothetical protein WBN50_13755 [Lutimonas sp.]
MKPVQFSIDEFIAINNLDLIEKIISQLNKDFNLSGNDFELETDLSPQQLIESLGNFVRDSLEKNVEGLMNLLYRIDVPESEMREAFKEINQLDEKLVYIILSKEYFKIYFRNRN